MKKLSALKDGSTLGLLATGSPLSPERWEKGIRALEQLGYQWKSPFDPTKYYGKDNHGFAAESVLVRTRGLYELLQDRTVAAILAVRGAYGTLDLLPRFEIEHARAAGKTLIGCSDVSVLLSEIAFHGEVPTIHGATLGSSFADYLSDDAAKQSVDMLLTLLRDPNFRYSARLSTLRGGKSSGRLLVSNLTMLLTVLGTPWDMNYERKILVLEEVNEAPYRVHRALTQLKLAGKFDKIAGVVFGRFSKCEGSHGPNITDIFKLFVSEITANAQFPVLCGLELGHWGMNIPLPVGCVAEIDSENFRVLESPIVQG